MKQEKIIANIERAAQELRAGRPVVVSEKKNKITVVSAESYSGIPCSSLLITAKRLSVITGKESKHGGRLAFDSAIKKGLGEIIGLNQSKLPKPLISKINAADNNTKLEEGALHLAKLSEIMPALLVCTGGATAYAEADARDIEKYEEVVAKNLKPICKAPLTLENAKNAEIVVFRAEGGIKEHYAILINTPKKNKVPLVRIHSACFTGDVLASLRCDCREQLQESIAEMNRAGGGILLYLVQDGRGIGLVNKLRAYSLQAQNFDTVEANEYLGFDDDERPFFPAASMLKQLGFKKVRLLTNNPRKIKSLKDCGIDVVERVHHMGTCHEHNREYLKTKISKLGHHK